MLWRLWPCPGRMHTPHIHTILGKPGSSRGPLYLEPGWMTQVKNILGIESHRRTGQRWRRRCQVERQARAALAEASLLQLWAQAPSRKLGVGQPGHRKQLVATQQRVILGPFQQEFSAILWKGFPSGLGPSSHFFPPSMPCFLLSSWIPGSPPSGSPRQLSPPTPSLLPWTRVSLWPAHPLSCVLMLLVFLVNLPAVGLTTVRGRLRNVITAPSAWRPRAQSGRVRRAARGAEKLHWEPGAWDGTVWWRWPCL